MYMVCAEELSIPTTIKFYRSINDYKTDNPDVVYVFDVPAFHETGMEAVVTMIARYGKSKVIVLDLSFDDEWEEAKRITERCRNHTPIYVDVEEKMLRELRRSTSSVWSPPF